MRCRQHEIFLPSLEGVIESKCRPIYCIKVSLWQEAGDDLLISVGLICLMINYYFNIR